MRKIAEFPGRRSRQAGCRGMLSLLYKYTQKLTPQRLEAKRVEHERTRQATRAKFEEQMRQLEAEQLAEERQLLSASNSPVNGAEAASAPTTPPGAARATISPVGNGAANGNGNGANGNGSNETAPIGPPNGNGAGAKSMPGSRRASGYGGSFGFENLSLSVMETGGKAKEWEDAGDETAEGTVKYLGMGDDDYPPAGASGKEHKHISAASAALDLAPLSQTRGASYASRPFDTGLKTSDWPSFPHNRTSTSPLASTGRTLDAGAAGQSEVLAGLGGGSRKTSPTGMADSIASLPAMPSKAVPSAAAGYNGGSAGAAAAFNGVGAGKIAQPPMPAFSLNDQPRPYAPDPLYGQMFGNAGMGGMGGAFGAGMGVNGGMPPVPPFDTGYDAGFDAYGFDDDPTGYGSGALYSGGAMVRNKRSDADREFNRFSGVRIEDLASEILLLSKDQHGCRYLQKVLEDGDPAHRDLIFREIFGHLPELMVDPFGNYLCQKLLEFSSEEQRNSIVDSVANDLVTISLNMHGTRAVQKMVDFLASPRQAKQIRTLIYALSMNVVALIKDLNGNHVRFFFSSAFSTCHVSYILDTV